MPKKHERVVSREAERMAAEGQHGKDVAGTMSRLGGRTISQVEPDHKRKASSPLGHGMGSKKMERKKGK
jgi:hypothetical protein